MGHPLRPLFVEVDVDTLKKRMPNAGKVFVVDTTTIAHLFKSRYQIKDR
jgi:hypothetical protein